MINSSSIQVYQRAANSKKARRSLPPHDAAAPSDSRRDRQIEPPGYNTAAVISIERCNSTLAKIK